MVAKQKTTAGGNGAPAVTWLGQVRDARRTSSSTVILVKSGDPKRQEEYLAYWQAQMRAAKSRDEPVRRVFLYDPHSGPRQLVLRNDSTFALQPLAIANQGAVFGGGGSPSAMQPGEAARALDGEVFPAQDGRTDTRGGVLIVSGMAKPDDAFTCAIRAWTGQYEYYARGGTVVVFTDDPRSILDQGTIDMCALVEPPYSTDDERRATVAKALAAAKKSEFAASQCYDSNGEPIVSDMFVESTRGLTLHQVESVALSSMVHAQRLDLGEVTGFKDAVIRKTGLLKPEPTDHGLDAVGGYGTLKAYLKAAFVDVLRSKRDRAATLKMLPPRGILLYGPPGTGKTWLATALGKELEVNFFSMGDFRGSLVGDTEKNMATIIKVAEENAPCVIFCDEIDAFAQRGGQEHETERHAYGAFLSYLGQEKRRAVIIGTTNRPEVIPREFLRPGRFDIRVPMLLPDRQARKDILRVHTQVLRKVPLDRTVDLDTVAMATEWYSGAEVVGVVRMAQTEALMRDADALSGEDFATVLAAKPLDLADRISQVEQYLNPRFCSDRRFLETVRKEVTTAGMASGASARGAALGNE